MSEAVYRTGLDIGGTKIEAVVLGPEGDIRARQRVAVPEGGYPACVDAVVELVRAVEAEAGAIAAGLGIGTPGSISPVTGKTCWR